MVRNLPEMQETWVQSMDWEDPLEEGIATHSSILAWRTPRTRSPVGYSPWGRKQSETTEQLTYGCFPASLVAQLVKNPSAMQETWVRFLDLEDPLEEGIATHSSTAWRIPMDRGAWQATVHGIAKSQTPPRLTHTLW